MTNHELIILALETLRDASYSIERRDRCQGLIEEIKLSDFNSKGGEVGASHWAINNPGLADQYRAEALAARHSLGFDRKQQDVSPSDLSDAIERINKKQIPNGFVPVAESVLRNLSEPVLVRSALGKVSPALCESLGCSNDEELAIESLFYAFESAVDFSAPNHPIGWVRCEDRLPKHDGDYLASDGKNVDLCSFYNRHKAFCPQTHDPEYFKKATHWMELPEPPVNNIR